MSRAAYFAAASVATAVIFSVTSALASASLMVVSASSERDGRANISLTSFSVSPHELHLKAAQPVLLRIANESSVAHDLTAPEFFAASAVPGASASSVVRGKIALGPHENVIVAIVPKAGRYPVKCSHAFHKMLGMSGTIIVDP